jgi:3-deoxy-D-manno-octulosonic-acid transferase
VNDLPSAAVPARFGLARLAYGLLMRALVPMMLLRLWWRGRAEPLYRRHLAERLGGWQGDGQTGRLWIHAVSLGETRAAAALVEALRRQQPGLRLLLTHGTATGRAAGQAMLQPGDAQAWLPWDSPGAVRRFLARHRPECGVLMETEVWPALLHEAQQRHLPMVLANARLSERSLRQAQRFAALLRPATASLGWVLAQTEGDAQRLRSAGARHTQVCGNLKFDMAPDPALLARGRAWRAALSRPVVLAASTREGEEAELLTQWTQAQARMPPDTRPLLLIVPRHPQRFDEVAALCLASGLVMARRSAWAALQSGLPTAADHAAQVWLGDSIGELPLYYAVADVALLGGSFAPLGGQNLIEAAACGCPLWMGPSTFNFAEAARLAEAAGAATRAPDMAQALAGALALLAHPDQQAAQAAAARAFAAAHRGAAERMARAILGPRPVGVV